LGRKVRAVVKSIDDRTHVIAQGQENSARANLSFIERAAFARGLENLGYEREVIATALATNAASLSKMMSVTERISSDVITAIGAAPGVGRERWVELSLLAGKAANAAKLSEIVLADDFAALPSNDRFTSIYKALNTSSRPAKKVDPSRGRTSWQTRDKSVQAEIKNSGKAFSISMKAKNAGRFGEYLSHKLDALYEQFLEEESGKET
jgi:ParB family chromosome partitioning protein